MTSGYLQTSCRPEEAGEGENICSAKAFLIYTIKGNVGKRVCVRVHACACAHACVCAYMYLCVRVRACVFIPRISYFLRPSITCSGPSVFDTELDLCGSAGTPPVLV